MSTDSQPPIYILWAGKATTCEGFADRVKREAPSKGYRPVVYRLDNDAVLNPGESFKDGPVVILTCTYDGKPVPTAQRFWDHLHDTKEQEWAGINYCVFGAGAEVFTDTYQFVPRGINRLISDRGGIPFHKIGEGDVGKFLYDTWELWRKNMWSRAETIYHPTPQDSKKEKFVVELKDITERHVILRQGGPDVVKAGLVVQNRTLTAPGFTPESRHMELYIKGVNYKPGDVVAILPNNAYADVREVMKRLRIHPLQEIVITADFAWMPTNKAILMANLLAKYVDLRYPATRSNIETLLQYVPNGYPDTKNALKNWLSDNGGYRNDTNVADTLWKKHIRVIDLLEEYPEIDLPIGEFLRMLQPMRARNYSISSSLLAKKDHLTLTYRVHDHGVCSQFLARLKKDDSLYLSVQPSSHEFHLPSNSEIPLIMIATGTGIAPLHGMLQQRAEEKKEEDRKEDRSTARTIGKTILFFGCSSRKDYLYGNSDLKEWERLGILEVYTAFSSEAGKVYVQDRIWEYRDAVITTYMQAMFLMADPNSPERVILACGSRDAAVGVVNTCVDILVSLGDNLQGAPLSAFPTSNEKKEFKAKNKVAYDEAMALVSSVRGQLYVTDVF